MNTKVILCKEEWKEKNSWTKKFLPDKPLNMKYKMAYKINN